MAIEPLLGLWPGLALARLLVLDVFIDEIPESAGRPLALAVLQGVSSIAYGDIVLLHSLSGLIERHSATAPDPHEAFPAVDPVREHDRPFVAWVDAHAKAGYLGVPSKVSAHAALLESLSLVREPADVALSQLQPSCRSPLSLFGHQAFS